MMPVERKQKPRSRAGSIQKAVDPAPIPPNVLGLERLPKGPGMMPSPRTKKPRPIEAGNGTQPRICTA